MGGMSEKWLRNVCVWPPGDQVGEEVAFPPWWSQPQGGVSFWPRPYCLRRRKNNIPNEKKKKSQLQMSPAPAFPSPYPRPPAPGLCTQPGAVEPFPPRRLTAMIQDLNVEAGGCGGVRGPSVCPGLESSVGRATHLGLQHLQEEFVHGHLALQFDAVEVLHCLGGRLPEQGQRASSNLPVLRGSSWRWLSS